MWDNSVGTFVSMYNPETVLISIPYTGSRPTFTQEPTHTSVKIGGDALLACEATGDPEPTIKWMKGDALVDVTDPYNRNRLMDNGVSNIHLLLY